MTDPGPFGDETPPGENQGDSSRNGLSNGPSNGLTNDQGRRQADGQSTDRRSADGQSFSGQSSEGQSSDGQSSDGQGADGQGVGGQSPEQAGLLGRMKKLGITANRLVIWIVVAGFGIYLLASGIVGMLTKAR
jgi:hypothetical protein